MIGYVLREMVRMEESYIYFQKALDLRLDLKEYDKASNTLNLIRDRIPQNWRFRTIFRLLYASY